MKYIFLFSVLWAFSFASCSKKNAGQKKEHVSSSIETIKKDSHSVDNILEEKIKRRQLLKDTVPVLGYRFVITGDFDGDRKKEKLIEHYFSGIDHKESPKLYEKMDYDQLVSMAVQKDPYCFVISSNTKIDTLQIASTSQLFGISYMKNEGDLNGDGTDEVSYVVDWADWSNLNTWHIVTYKNKRWEELYSFPIWDWQLPPLPSSANQYSLFGTADRMVITNDTLNQRIEKELFAFEGLVKKIKTNKIQIIYRNEESMEDSLVVDLRNPIPAAR